MGTHRKRQERPEVNDVLRTYLRLLLAGRKLEVLGDAMGLGRSGTGHVLNGRREVQPSHMDSICEAWGIEASTLFGHLARVAQNMELGLAPEDGLRLPSGPSEVSASDAR